MIMKKPIKEIRNTLFMIGQTKNVDWVGDFSVFFELVKERDGSTLLTVRPSGKLTNKNNSAHFGEIETESVYTIPPVEDLVSVAINAIGNATQEFNQKCEFYIGFELGTMPTEEEYAPLIKSKLAAPEN